MFMVYKFNLEKVGKNLGHTFKRLHYKLDDTSLPL